MNEITSEQLDQIISALDTQPAHQETLFYELFDFEQSAFWEPETSPPFILVVREADVEAHIGAVISDPVDYVMLDDKRMKELMNGDGLTSDEIANEIKAFAEREAENERAELLCVAKAYDRNSRSIFIVFAALLRSQLGIELTQFVGFFSTEELAWQAAENLEGVVQV